MINNKNILITGGTGSFGKSLLNYLLKNFKPKDQNLGNLFKGSLETIKEVLGRDASQFTNDEFFGV